MASLIGGPRTRRGKLLAIASALAREAVLALVQPAARAPLRHAGGSRDAR